MVSAHVLLLRCERPGCGTVASWKRPVGDPWSTAAHDAARRDGWTLSKDVVLCPDCKP